MFKKILNLSIVGVLTLSFLPQIVNASIFQDGNKKYELKLITNTCSLNSDAERDGVLINMKKLVFVDENKNTTREKEYYLVDENNVCTEMTVQQILDYHNQTEYHYDIDEDFKFIKIKYPITYSGYISAAGTTYSEDEEYYVLSHLGYNLTEPVEEELNNYYVNIKLSYPTKAEIDEDITYYTMDANGGLTEVLDPKVEDIYLYYYKSSYQGSLFIGVTEKTFDKTLPSKLITAFNEREYIFGFFGNDNERFILAPESDEKTTLYDDNGNLISYTLATDFSSIVYIQSLFFVSYYDIEEDILTYKIFNKKGEMLYSGEDIRFNTYFYTEEEKGISILTGYKTPNEYKTYLLKEYSLLTENNQTYNNKNNNDMTFKFSGDYNDVDTIKVNDVELNEDDYTLTNGSTIVTLKKEYLNSLSTGDYVLKVTYNNSIELTADFEVDNINNPKTGDGIDVYVIIGSISIIGLIAVGVGLYFKKKKNK